MPIPLLAHAPPARTYARRRPEATALYEVVRDNLETLVGAVDDGALAFKLPKHARKELDAYLDCGLLCRGFARLRCAKCPESLTPRVQLQGPRLLPVVHGSAHVRDRRAPEASPHLTPKNRPKNGFSRTMRSNSVIRRSSQSARIALIRKNSLFFGSVEAGRRYTVLHTLLACCDLAKVNPFDYFADVLLRIKSTPEAEWRDLLPDRWAPRGVAVGDDAVPDVPDG